MGLDTVFTLRIKNGLKDRDIKTKEQYRQSFVDLLFLGRVSETVDNLIMSISKERPEVCYIGMSEENKKKGNAVFDTVIVEKPEFPDTEFEVDWKELSILTDKIKPLAKILSKYSDRIISDLVENYEDGEISKSDRTQIKDLLYEINPETSYEDIFFLLKIYEFFTAFFMSEINSEYSSSGLKADLIYWRSY